MPLPRRLRAPRRASASPPEVRGTLPAAVAQVAKELEALGMVAPRRPPAEPDLWWEKPRG